MTWLHVLAAVSGGLLLSVLVAPLEVAWLHWVAYAPMLWMLRADEPRRNVGLLLLYGTVAEAAIFSWIAETITLFSNIPAPLAWAILVLFAVAYGLPYLLTFALLHPLRRRLGDLWMIALPCWLVIVEWLSTWIILFPYQQGVSQYRTPWVWQLASVTGVWGVSWLVLFVNLPLGEWIYRRREGRPAPVRWLVAAAALLAAVVGFGAWRLPRVEAVLADAPVLRVHQVQTDRDMVWRMSRPSSEGFEFWVDRTRKLERGAADLVVWPEGAVPYQLNASSAVTLLWDLVREGDFDLVVGAGTRERELGPEGEETKVRVYNSTYFFSRERLKVPDGVPGPEQVWEALVAAGCDPAAAHVVTPFEARRLAQVGAERGEAPACVERLEALERELRGPMTVTASFEHAMDGTPGLWEAFRFHVARFGRPPVERTFGRRGGVDFWWLRDAGCEDDDCTFVIVRCARGACDVVPEAPHYDKLVPLPFGEYLPLGETFPWLADLIEGPGNFRGGTEPVVFAESGARLATPICYEAILGYVCDRFEAPDLLVNVTNDAWFGDTAASALHGMLAAVRATELGIPLFRSAYTGLSFVVEPHGRVHSEAPLFTEVSRVVEVRLGTVETVYRRLGDWFVAACGLALVVLGALGRRRG